MGFQFLDEVRVVDTHLSAGAEQQDEAEQSAYGFEHADVGMLREAFDRSEGEATRLLTAGLVLPTYDYVLKCSHLFNLLDARRAIGVAERTTLMARCRQLARRCADRYVARREELGFPLRKGTAGGKGRKPRRRPAPRGAGRTAHA